MWGDDDRYERFMGRWSRPLAASFVSWVSAPVGARWIDVGSGTGALRAAVEAGASPSFVVGLDPAFRTDVRGGAESLPLRDGAVDVAVSGLVLNFVPDVARALRELGRVARGGLVGAYVWDHADGMQFLRVFWDVAVELDPRASAEDEGRLFDLCRAGALEAAFVGAGLTDVRATPLVVPTVFADFDDFWDPFLGSQGPASAYVVGLAADDRDRLRDVLRERLASDGPIELTARAWAARGRA